MLTWRDVLIQEARHKELLREAEMHQLSRLATATCGRKRRFYCRALVSLGCQLVRCGIYLQERQGVAPIVPRSQPATEPQR